MGGGWGIAVLAGGGLIGAGILVEVEVGGTGIGVLVIVG